MWSNNIPHMTLWNGPLYSTFDTLSKLGWKYFCTFTWVRFLMPDLYLSIFTLLYYYQYSSSATEDNTDNTQREQIFKGKPEWDLLSTPFSPFQSPHSLLHPHWSCPVTWQATVQVVLKNAPNDSTTTVTAFAVIQTWAQRDWGWGGGVKSCFCQICGQQLD